MGANYQLVKTFIRVATEDSDYVPITDINEVYARLRVLQDRQFNAITQSGTTLISSSVSGKSFNFAIPEELSSGKIMEIAEEALSLVERYNDVTSLRRILIRQRTTVPAFGAVRSA